MAAPLPSDPVSKAFNQIERLVDEEDWSGHDLDKKISQIREDVLTSSHLSKNETAQLDQMIQSRRIYPTIQGLDENLDSQIIIISCKNGGLTVPREKLKASMGVLATALRNDPYAEEIPVNLSVQEVKNWLEIQAICDHSPDAYALLYKDPDILSKLNHVLATCHYLDDIETLDVIAGFILNDRSSLIFVDSEILELWKNFLNLPHAKVPAITENIRELQEAIWQRAIRWGVLEDKPEFYFFPGHEHDYDIKEMPKVFLQFLKDLDRIPATFENGAFSYFNKFVEFLKKRGFDNFDVDMLLYADFNEDEPMFPTQHLVKVSINYVFSVSTLKMLSENCPRLTHLKLSGRDIEDPDQLTADAFPKGFSELRDLEFKNVRWLTPERMDTIIKNCPELRKLKISYCEGVTPEYIDSLRKRDPELPELNIIWDRYGL